jgi:hypothetical protein
LTLKKLVDHLEIAELPRTAKHGTKAAAEATIVEELITENEDWKALAHSTIESWIGKVEDISLEVFQAPKDKPITFHEAIAKLGVKGGTTCNSDEQFQIMRSLLSIGKVIFESIEAKNKKITEARQAAVKKAARKRNLKEIANSSGKKSIKKERYANL